MLLKYSDWQIIETKDIRWEYLLIWFRSLHWWLRVAIPSLMITFLEHCIWLCLCRRRSWGWQMCCWNSATYVRPYVEAMVGCINDLGPHNSGEWSAETEIEDLPPWSQSQKDYSVEGAWSNWAGGPWDNIFRRWGSSDSIEEGCGRTLRGAHICTYLYNNKIVTEKYGKLLHI